MKSLPILGSAAAISILSWTLSCGGDPANPGGTGGQGEAGEGGQGGDGGSGAGTGGKAGAGGMIRRDAGVTAGTGGSGGDGTGGTAGAGTGGTGGSAGTGGTGGPGEPDAGSTTPDAGASPDSGAGGGPANPGTPGQGPTALGTIVYSQDFEAGNHEGISRSPNGLPADRVTVVDDPLKQRGKVLKVTYLAGDNFRTSPGTEPRNWVSNRPGNEFVPGANMSHAFGIMVTSSTMNYCFAQIISSGGPVWMLIGGSDGTLTVFCNTCGGNTRHMKIEPNRWYDFRVDIDFKIGGPVNFFVDGQMFRQGRVESTRGNIAHWDGGIYNRAGGGGTRTVYISNLSVGKR